MSVQCLQCPSCGASVMPDGRSEFFCSYCGARLRVRTGASGNSMAVLDGIKEDTGLLAKRTALEHLVGQRGSLQAEHARLTQEYRTQAKIPGAHPSWFLLAFLILLSCGLAGTGSSGTDASVCGAVLIFVAVLALMAGIVGYVQRDGKKREIEAACRACLAKIRSLEEAIAELDGRIGELDAEISKAVSDLR